MKCTIWSLANTMFNIDTSQAAKFTTRNTERDANKWVSSNNNNKKWVSYYSVYKRRNTYVHRTYKHTYRLTGTNTHTIVRASSIFTIPAYILHLIRANAEGHSSNKYSSRSAAKNDINILQIGSNKLRFIANLANMKSILATNFKSNYSQFSQYFW